MVCSSMPFALILSATSCLVSLRSRKEKMMLVKVFIAFSMRWVPSSFSMSMLQNVELIAVEPDGHGRAALHEELP